MCVFQKATDGKGVDVVIEMLANVNLSKDLEMLAQGGRVAVSRTTVQEITAYLTSRNAPKQHLRS